MENVFVDEESFEKIDFTITEFKKGEYEYCTFTQCDFTKVDLSTMQLILFWSIRSSISRSKAAVNINEKTAKLT